ncbi:metalloregulator ArsR/SmtB family transcription factor [Vicingaceae bacterium]|nr:metalloregulator ArsR/SmtB family transcription factor [Vicingaceae bacterium]
MMIRKRRTKQLDFDALTMAAECLKALAHPSRLQIVQNLMTGKRYSVNDLAAACNLSQPATSDHLRLMQRCGFLTSERDGRTVYYEISEQHLHDIMACIQDRFG